LKATAEDLSTGDSYIVMESYTERVTSEGDYFTADSFVAIGQGQAINLNATLVLAITSDGDVTVVNVVFHCS
jgi:hypothetical protein